MFRTVLLVLLALTASCPAHAQSRSLEDADEALNTLYRTIQSRLSGDKETKENLVKAQRAWVSFRDAECNFAITKSGKGSGSVMIYEACQQALTEKRLEDFHRYLRCEEGDLTCPVPWK